MYKYPLSYTPQRHIYVKMLQEQPDAVIYYKNYPFKLYFPSRYHIAQNFDRGKSLTNFDEWSIHETLTSKTKTN